jgi:ribosomal protein S18 acetylase RimI-like enzyme
MTLADLPAVMRIGDEVHQALPEDEEVFRERLMLFPEGCFVLEIDQADGADQTHALREQTEDERKNAVKETPKTQETNPTRHNIGGYIISFPIRRNHPPPLNSRLPGGVLPASADQYYLHDVAVLPQFRHHGAASAGVRAVLGLLEGAEGNAGEGDEKGCEDKGRDKRGPAAEYETTALVSVYGTERFWEKSGFRVVATAEKGLVLASEEDRWLGKEGYEQEFWEAMRQKLKGYGEEAKFMVRRNHVE